MSNHKKDLDYRPCDQRFRTSEYFLDDQLRCSAAADDLRGIKEILGKLHFSFGAQPALAPVIIHTDSGRTQKRR